jgi:predicted DNA-binding transcriptional regulator AlpA
MSMQNAQRQEPSASLLGPKDPTDGRLGLDGYLRRDELAQHLGVSVRTIDRWHFDGEGPPRIVVVRTILYSVDSVREWLCSRKVISG